MEHKAIVELSVHSSDTKNSPENDDHHNRSWHKLHYKVIHGQVMYTTNKQGKKRIADNVLIEFHEGKYTQTFRNISPKILIGPEEG